MRNRLGTSAVAIVLLAAPPAQRAEGAATEGGSAPRVVREHWDVSGSPMPEASERVAERLGGLAPLVEAFPSLRRWELREWATRADLLKPPTGLVDLPRLDGGTACGAVLGEGAILQAVQEQARRECEARRLEREREVAAELAAARDAVREARSRLSAGRTARQTCFWQLLAHLAADARPAIHLVISDGVDEQCGEPPESLGPPVEGARIFVILVPAQSDATGRTDPLRRTEEIRRRLPGVAVLWAADLDPDWAWLIERAR